MTIFAKSGRRAALTAALTLLLGGLPLLACGQSPQVVAAPPVATAFDGRAIYEKAFEALRDDHYTLVTAAARVAFTAGWQHLHDNDKMLTTEKGTDLAIYQMMWSLGQRFDYYYPPAGTDSEKEEEASTHVGVGLSIGQEGLYQAVQALGPKPTFGQIKPLLELSDSRPLVVRQDPDQDTPAGQAHVQRGDLIVAVDGVSLNGLTTDQAVDKIRGRDGTSVTLTLAHKDDAGRLVTRDVTMTRKQVTVHPVRVEYQGRIAHISLSNFMSQLGPEEMADAASTAGQNASGIVLDLRDNPGGEVSQVLDIAQMFIPQGLVFSEHERRGDHMVTTSYSLTSDKLVVTVQADDGSPAQVEYHDRIPLLVPANKPMIVLINGGSASASEILSGALQARGRVRVMGEPSYGKGVGQIEEQLPADRLMHVTNFEFFPGGVQMDWVGIIPDIEVALPEGTDYLLEPESDTQLHAAELEMINTAAGHPTPSLSATALAARRAQVESQHRQAFQDEVKERQELIEAAAGAKAQAPQGTAQPQGK